MIAHVIKLITNIKAFAVDIVDVDDGLFGAVVQVVPLLSLGRWSSDDALAQKRGCSSMKTMHKQNERLFISSPTRKKVSVLRSVLLFYFFMTVFLNFYL